MLHLSSFCGGALVLCLGGSLFLLAACGGGAEIEPVGLTVLSERLPHEASGWSANEPDELFDTESIFSYIDGHAEVYLAYGMQGCLARRFVSAGDGPSIVLDVFEMTSPYDAFGVWTHDRAGDVVDVGQDGVLKHGWLSAWQDQYFISVYAEEGTPEAREAMLEIGRATAAAIGSSGPRPPLLQVLPEEGLDLRSVCYLHHPVILRAHLQVDPENLLRLGEQTPAVIADFSRDAEKARVLVVDYPDEWSAKVTLESLAAELPAIAKRREESGDAIAGGWVGGRGSGRRLAVVSEASSQEFVALLLDELLSAQDGD